MKNILSTFCFFIALSLSYAQEDYTLSINGESVNFSLDKEFAVAIEGKEYKILIKENDTILHDDKLFKFKRLKEFRPSKTQVDTSIEQLMMSSASGSGILIQSYGSFDPTMLSEMMLNEVTKESVSYGYSLERQDYERVLASGQKIKVLKAKLDYKGEVEYYEIASYGKKDEGIMIMTMDLDTLGVNDGKNMIELLWNSLEIKL